MPSETKNPKNNSALLRVDTKNSYADVVESGVARAELGAFAATIARVHASVSERRRGGLDAEYGCLNLHEAMPAMLDEIAAEATKLSRFDDVIVLGIGGSN